MVYRPNNCYFDSFFEQLETGRNQFIIFFLYDIQNNFIFLRNALKEIHAGNCFTIKDRCTKGTRPIHIHSFGYQLHPTQRLCLQSF